MKDNMKPIFLPLLFACFVTTLVAGESPITFSVGSWKATQTIQPWAYSEVCPVGSIIDVKGFANSTEMKNAVLSGSLDMGGQSLPTIISSAVAGEPLVMVSSLCDHCSALVVHKDAGITKAADLKGKRIGYPRLSIHHFLLVAYLTKNGLTTKDVNLVPVEYFDSNTALASRSVDAYCSGEPFPTQSVDTGVGTILAYPYVEEAIGGINAGLLVSRKLLESDPAKVQTMVTAHARATQMLLANEEKWLALGAKITGKPVELWKKIRPNIGITWDMDEAWLKHVKNLGNMMLEEKMIKQLPDYDKMIDRRFVVEAKRILDAEKTKKP